MLDNLQVIPGEAFTATGSVMEKLIDKVSNAVGWVVIPNANKTYQLESEKYLIEQIKNDSNMPPVAKAAAISKVRSLIKKYSNQHEILSIATQYLEENIEPEKVDDDWLNFFFEKAQNINQKDVQFIWGNILAKEFNSPNSISKHLLHILTIIDYNAAESFKKLADYCILVDGKDTPIIWLDAIDKIYYQNNLTVDEIFQLVDIGLAQVSTEGYIYKLETDEKLMYLGNEIDIGDSKTISAGNVILSKAGEELMSILTDRRCIDGFEALVNERLLED